MCYLGRIIDVVRPRQTVGDIYTLQLGDLNHLHLYTIGAAWGVYSIPLPEVDE